MPDTTPNGAPYPLPEDPNDVPAYIQQLAEWADDKLATEADINDSVMAAAAGDGDSDFRGALAGAVGEELATDWSPANIYLAPSRFNVRTKGAHGLGADEHVAILSAVEDAVAKGGHVQWAAGDYNMGGFPLVPKNGVTFDLIAPGQTQDTVGGAGYSMNFNSEWDETGTRLRGNGTAPGIWDGQTDQGAYAADMDTLAKKSFNIEGGAWFENFTVAIKAGAQNRPGLSYGDLGRIYVAKSCGASLELWNPQELDLDYLMDGGTLGGPLIGANISPFVPGNSRINKIYRMLPSVADAGGADALRKYRGIRLVALAGSVLNEIIFEFPQSTGYNVTELSVAGACVSGSANITVPDGTKFQVGMIVRTASDATFNGTDERAYLVKSVAGNVITLAYTLAGSAIVSSGTGAVTFKTRGYADLEVYATGGGAITATDLRHCDLEGDRVGVFLEGFRGTLGLYEVPGSPVTSAVIRNSQATTYSGGIASTNMDTNSRPLSLFSGRVGTQEWATADGIYYDEILGQSRARANNASLS